MLPAPWPPLEPLPLYCLAKGGIHYGEADSAAQEAILDWDGKFFAFGSSASKMAIVGLCRVVLTGLQPLIATFSRPT